MRAVLGAALLLLMLCVAGPAARAADAATGPFVHLEGSLGLDSFQPFGNGSLVKGDPAQLWRNPGNRNSFAWGGRGEAGWDLGGDGTIFRLGVIVSGWRSQQQDDDPIEGGVVLEPNPMGGKPYGEIAICDEGEPCYAYDQEIRRSYWEVMPELAVGFPGAEGALYWIGLQPFYGELVQDSHSYFDFSGPAQPAQWGGVENRIDSKAYGALLTATAETWLSQSLKLVVSGGVGPYVLKADSVSRGRRFGAEVKDSATLVGVRGQLSLAGEVTLADNLSLGLVGRADFWSDQPFVEGINGDFGGQAPCAHKPNGDLVCEPPSAVGDYNIFSDTRLNLFVGLGMTYRF